VETAKEFNAMASEHRIPLHDKHHEQVNIALEDFHAKVRQEIASTQVVDTTQGPNEKKANAYLDAMLNLALTNEEERGLIIKAKEALRQGRFQNLQRDINKFQRTLKKFPLKPAIILEKVIEILKAYPLMNEEAEQVFEKKIVRVKTLNPEIIITESFSE
jgi:hypothetical protein